MLIIVARTRIVQPVPTVSALEGARVNLSCVVYNDPYYILTRRWYHNSSLINTRAFLDDNGSLILPSLSRADAGLYTCIVDSDGGRDNSSGWIHIIG